MEQSRNNPNKHICTKQKTGTQRFLGKYRKQKTKNKHTEARLRPR